MTNHFHLFIYQEENGQLEKFMRSLMTSYSKYFNLKYKRSGPLFESRYKAVMVDNDSYLQHITRYIHLNPRLWESHKYSSLKYYREGNEPEWLHTEAILEIFEGRNEYLDFISDYEEMRDEMNVLKYQLADH